MKTPCAGLDIGGANLKIVHHAGEVRNIPFALWKSPNTLGDQLRHLFAGVPPFDWIGVAMTGELCDCYPSKREGVRHIVDSVMASAAGRKVLVWALPGRFVEAATAIREPGACAATNWHALATWVARKFAEGFTILVDTGSTTTDIIPLEHGRVRAVGRNDTERLVSGELLYLGASRTPLISLGPTVEWRGRSFSLMAEYFATTQDVFLLTGCCPEDPSSTETCDGQPLTVTCSARRLLRMIGADLESFDVEDARSLARVLGDRCVERVVASMRQVIAGQQCRQVILSGSGDHLAATAVTVAVPEANHVMLHDLVGCSKSHAACAWALAQLAASWPPP